MRMVARFVNEAALCLQDEIIATPAIGGTSRFLVCCLGF